MLPCLRWGHGAAQFMSSRHCPNPTLPWSRERWLFSLRQRTVFAPDDALDAHQSLRGWYLLHVAARHLRADEVSQGPS